MAQLINLVGRLLGLVEKLNAFKQKAGYVEAGLWIFLWWVQNSWCAERKSRVINDKEAAELCFSFLITEVESII